ncbi:MAG: choice-of-anchor D domain-containing protein [Betaproteobacteria bacterium]
MTFNTTGTCCNRDEATRTGTPDALVRSWSLLLLLIVALVVSRTARAGDSVIGKGLYNNIPEAVISCGNASCHGPNPNDNVNGLLVAGNNPGIIQTAIKSGVTQMMFLNGLLNPFQIGDIAAYLAPQPTLSDDYLDFGNQPTGAASAAQFSTLSNAGGVNLAVSAIQVTGANAADFSVTGNCTPGTGLLSTTLDRPGGSCLISVTFDPATSGPRNATVSLSYGGTTTFPSSQSIVLTGSGIAQVLLPQASLSADSIDFGEVAVNETAPPRALTLSNSGSAPLVVDAIELFGPQADEFSISGSCATSSFPLTLNPASTCEIVLGFAPLGSATRAAALRIHHNAAGNPGFVSLVGFAKVLTCQPPSPPAEFRTLSCSAGQQGTLQQRRSFACAQTIWIPGMWVTTSNTCQQSLPAPDLDLNEYLNSLLNHYFMTADPAEKQGIETGGAGPGWSATAAGPVLGRVWSAATDGLVPVCRFYGNLAPGPNGLPLGPNSHFYTADAGECAAVKNDIGWKYEGVVFHVAAATFGACPAPLVPVYRVYNGRFAENDSNHRYAVDPAVVAQMTNLGWTPESVVFCIAPP